MALKQKILFFGLLGVKMIRDLLHVLSLSDQVPVDEINHNIIGIFDPVFKNTTDLLVYVQILIKRSTTARFACLRASLRLWIQNRHIQNTMIL